MKMDILKFFENIKNKHIKKMTKKKDSALPRHSYQHF